jgi:hypothetical protein
MDMPGIVPDTQQGAIDFFSSRTPTWAANQAAIGISAAQVVDIDAKVTAAQTKLAAAQAARNAAKTATLDLADAMNDMRGFGGDLIKTIRAFAETTDDDTVYVLSDIPPVSPPTPAGPPDQPTVLAADILLPFGIGLTWKGSVSQSAYFSVWRKVDSDISFSLIGTTKSRDFEDRSLPAQTASVDYYIAAIRDTFTVNSASLSIQIGSDGAGAMTLAA